MMDDATPLQPDTRHKPLKIGFPAPLFGPDNHRVEVLHNAGGLLALERPAGVVMNQHPWYPGAPVLAEALRMQLHAGKPELMRLGLRPDAQPRAVFSMDPQIAGVALLAMDEPTFERARNDYGSQLYTLRFQLVAMGGPDEDDFVCELPVAQHITRPCSLVSHQTGKKTETRFRRLERLGRWNLWEAVAIFYRPDQLALHATEAGLRIPGDDKYAHEPLIFLSQLKRKWVGDKETEPPLAYGMAAWLSDVRLEDGTEISAPMPPRLGNLLRQLRKYG